MVQFGAGETNGSSTSWWLMLKLPIVELKSAVELMARGAGGKLGREPSTMRRESALMVPGGVAPVAMVVSDNSLISNKSN